ncbi:hypothetical protein [Brevibacillus laterosporus]|uniref:hypothetical protein n=1 Tax=Brevibacillus laterosporus TaxID=1465 RepID=UPI003D25860B
MAYICVIDGEKGAGKTTFMSLFAMLMLESFPSTTLWSNYELRHAQPFVSYTDFLTMASLDFNLVLWDEAYTSMDSRNASNNKGQMYLTQIFNLLRKIRTILVMSAVNMKSLDSRVREDIDIYIFARIKKGSTVYEFYDYRTERLLNRKVVNRDRMKALLGDVHLFKSWRPVSPLILPDKDSFPIFAEKLKVINDEWVKNNHPDIYYSFENSELPKASFAY